MTGSRKILSVSYGTYSCTADGFEDPLRAVKETTQYFRGVVKQDRFFGAEPPRFDAEVAQELLRREIAAERRGDGVALQPAWTDEDGQDAQPGAALPGDPPEGDAKGIVATSGAGWSIPSRAQTAAFTPPPAARVPAADFAETLARIRAVVARPDATPEAHAADEPVKDGDTETPAGDERDTGDDTAGSPIEAAAATLDAMAAGGDSSDSAADDAALPADADSADPSVLAAEHDDAVPETMHPNLDAPVAADPAGDAANLDAYDDEDAVVPRVQPETRARPLRASLNSMPDTLAAELEAQIVSRSGGRSAWVEPEADEEFDASVSPRGAIDATAESWQDTLAAVLDAETQDDRAEPDEDSAAFGADDAAWDEEDDDAFDDLSALYDDEPLAPASSGETTGEIADWSDLDNDAGYEDDAAPARASAPQTEADAQWPADEEDAFDDLLAGIEESSVAGTGAARRAAASEADREIEPDAARIDAPTETAPAEAAPRPRVRARVVTVKRSRPEPSEGAARLGAQSDRLVAQSSLAPDDEAELASELAAVRAELDHAHAHPAPAQPQAPLRLDNPLPEESLAPEPQPAAVPAARTQAPEDRIAQDNVDPDARDAEMVATTQAELADFADPERATFEDYDYGRLHPDASGRPVRAEIESPADDDDFDIGDLRRAVKLTNPGRAILTEREVGETDTDRLLDRTDSAMDEPEGSRRRNAIAHLRQAVAATRADRLLGRRSDAEEQERDRYKEDLANAVRPRRPEARGTTRTERPAESAPLRLVPQNRAMLEPEQPVQPRRVSRAMPDVADADTAGKFADYADSVGAKALPELLEAAAAYMSFVEGRDQFSRPQLMSVLSRVDGGRSSREDRLRSFGRLLRDGKIEKTRSGRFTATGAIGFQPDDRAVG